MFRERGTYLAQARVGAHGPQALVALEGHQELEAPDEGLVRQGFHPCGGWCRVFVVVVMSI